MVQWKTMALWFSLESECFLSAIFQLLNEKWAIIIRKHCFLSRLASSLWESVYRQYFEKKTVKRLSWCKSVPGVNQRTDLYLCRHLPSCTTEISSLPCKIPLSADCVHMCYGACNCKHFCMQVTLNRKAVVNFDENLSILWAEAHSEQKCWSAIQIFILQDNIVL